MSEQEKVGDALEDFEAKMVEQATPPSKQNLTEKQVRWDIQVLKRAQRILQNPEAWGQGRFWGLRATLEEKAIDRFCAAGACRAAAAELVRRRRFEKLPAHQKAGWTYRRTDAELWLLEELYATKFNYRDYNGSLGHVTAFNDSSSRTHAEVLALFEGAIKRAEEKLKEVTA